MPGKFEGKSFHRTFRGDIHALVQVGVMLDRDQMFLITERLSSDPDERNEIQRTLMRLEVPIFTFSDPDKGQDRDPWFTGSVAMLEMLCRYIVEEGGEILERSFPVPFSYGAKDDMNGPGSKWAELQFVTSRQQFQDAFGLSLGETLTRVEESLAEPAATG